MNSFKCSERRHGGASRPRSFNKMADPDIERWQNCGSIAIWRYEDFPRNYPGYHLTADARGCAFLLGLIKLFQNAKYPARKLVELTNPTPQHLAIPNCPRKCVPLRAAEFRFRSDYPDSHWSIRAVGKRATIEIGSTGLHDLEQGVSDIVLCKGDWATGNGNDALWFWPHPHQSMC